MNNRISMFAQSRAVKVGQIEIHVNQMTWKDAILFGAELTKRSSYFLQNLDKFKGVREKIVTSKEDPKGFETALNDLVGAILELISGDKGLVNEFVLRVTDLTREEVDHVPISGMLDIVAEGIDLNFSEGLVKKFSTMAGKLAAALPQGETVSQTTGT